MGHELMALRSEPLTPGVHWYFGTPSWQFLVLSQSHGGKGCGPSEVVVVAWEVSIKSAGWVLWQMFVSDLSSWHCAVQGELSQVRALLGRALNEIVGAAEKLPQDLSEAERIHTLAYKTWAPRQSASFNITLVYGTSQVPINKSPSRRWWQ